jgi:hypothetical protein
MLFRPGTRLVLVLFFVFAGAQTLRGNSISSVVVGPDGSIYFSDYVRNRIWKVSPGGQLMEAVAGKHTHHLVIDQTGTLYGEHIPTGGLPTLWERSPDGKVSEILRAIRHGQALSYPGSVFTVDPRGGLEFVRECQIVRLSGSGSPEPWAGRRCAGDVFKDDALRYGHLHGSFAWAPDGTLLFSDGRTIRRILPNGEITTLRGRSISLFAAPQPDEAHFDLVMGLVVNPSGTIFVADQSSRSILRVDANGATKTFYQLPFFSSPIGLGSAGSDLYLLTDLRMPTPGFLTGLVGNPTLRKIGPDGRAKVIASPTHK